ncbi:MAG: HD domain-containing protein [Treponema sp.]|jgi:HD-GYP domain-containing protein (c-di-GMP phosphodiesterase class II)|nr:HD domain-containing protein [Treponema sp.]
MTEAFADFRSILRLDSELNQIQDVDILLERILLECRKVVRAGAGSIYIKETSRGKEENAEKLLIRYSQNDAIQKELLPGQKLIYSVFSVPINDSTISGYCAKTKTLVNIPNAYNIPRDAPYSFSPEYDKISGYKTISVLAIPLVTVDGRLLGVIQVINSTDKEGKIVPFSAEDEFLVTHFAASATQVLQRAFVTRAMILRMIRMSELRDPKETGTHVNRVAGYAVEIYDRWAYNHAVTRVEQEKFRDILKIGAMLHDVGKVAISDMILKKPARFTPEEFAIMQHHTIYGAGLFYDPQSDLDNISWDIALTHHENWDGSGYPGWVDPVTGKPVSTDSEGRPLGRKGEEIPFAGRIVAIADVFDALCSRRIYKEPWSEEQVLQEIRNLSGIKFDPELVDVFFEILPHIKQVQNFYPESV